MADSTQLSNQQSSGQSTAASSGGQYFFDPQLAQSLASALGGLQQNLIPQYQNFIANPTAHPLFQNQLSGLLASLAPSEAQARGSLADTFRAAGGLRSGAYGFGASNLEGNLIRNRQEVASKLLGQVFPQVTQSLQQPLSQISALLQALQLSQQQSNSQSTQQSSGSSSGQSSSPQQPSGGTSGGMSAGSLLDSLARMASGGGTRVGAPQAPTGTTSAGTGNYGGLEGASVFSPTDWLNQPIAGTGGWTGQGYNEFGQPVSGGADFGNTGYDYTDPNAGAYTGDLF